MAVEYEKQKQQIEAAQVRMVRGRRGGWRRGGREDTVRKGGYNNKQEKKILNGRQRRSEGGCHRMALSQALLRLMPM